MMACNDWYRRNEKHSYLLISIPTMNSAYVPTSTATYAGSSISIHHHLYNVCFIQLSIPATTRTRSAAAVFFPYFIWKDT
jgi:hypothetical protein